MTVEQKTFRHHIRYMTLRAPAIALSMQFAAFIAVKSLGATEFQAVLISLAIPVGNLLGFFWPSLMATRERIPFAFWPDFVGFLILLPMFLVVSPGVFVALVFMTSLLRSATIVALSGVMRDNYPPVSRASMMGKIQSAAMGISALSGIVFGPILEGDMGAYRYLFPFVAILGIVAVWQLRKIPEEDPAKRIRRRKPALGDFFRVLWGNKDFLRYELSFFVFGSAVWTFIPLLPLYMAQDLQVDYQKGALVLVVVNYGIPCLLAPVFGKIIDRVNVLLVRGVLNVCWSFAPLIIFVTDSFMGVLIGKIIISTVLGGGVIIWQLGINIFASKEDVPTYMGIHQCLTGIRGLFAPLIGLQLARFLADPGAAIPNYRAVFLVCWVVTLLAGIYMIWESQYLHRTGKPTTFAHAEKGEK